MTIKKLLFLLILLSVSWCAFSIISYKSTERSAQEPLTTDPNRPIQISGLRYSDYYDDSLVSRLQFDNLQVRPRRFGPIKIQSVNEVFIRNARIERLPAPRKENTQSEHKSSISKQLSGSLKNLLKSQRIGRVQRVVFDGLQYIRIDSHAEGIASKVMARHAEYVFRQKKLILTKASLNDFASTRHLIAKTVEWNERKRAWWVSGKGTLRSQNQPAVSLKNIWLTENLEPF